MKVELRHVDVKLRPQKLRLGVAWTLDPRVHSVHVCSTDESKETNREE